MSQPVNPRPVGAIQRRSVAPSDGEVPRSRRREVEPSPSRGVPPSPSREVPPALAKAWSRREFVAWSLASGAAAWLPGASAETRGTRDTHEPGAWLADHVRTRCAELGLPGLAVAALGPDGVECASSGVRSLAAESPIEPQDAWPLAGHAAVVTAALISRLVERRALEWSTTIGATLGYQLIPRMHPDWAEVTIADLLAHRAGLPRYAEPLALLSLTTAADGDSSVIRQRLRACAHVLSAPAARVPVRREPAYSHVGPLVATAVVESLLDRSFEDLLAETFASDGVARASGGDVHGHLRHAGRWRVQPLDGLPWSHAVLAPTGALAVPARTYAGVLQSLLESARNARSPAAIAAASVALGPAAGWRLERGRVVPTLVQSSVDPRGYSIVAVAQPSLARAVVVWANGMHAGVPERLVEIAGTLLPA